MSRLYDEALLDAKKIREIAEQSAKDRIMESITPQIRKMINDRILFEQEDVELEDEEEAFPLDEPVDEFDSGVEIDSIVDQMPDIDLDNDTAEKVMDAAADAAISVYAAGDVNIEIEQEDDEGDDEEMGLMTDKTMAEAFASLVRNDFVEDSKLAKRITTLEEKVTKLRDVMSVVKEGKVTQNQQHRLELSFVSLIREAVSLQSDLKRSGRGSQRLEKRLNSTIKEMREMSNKYKKNIFDFLFEAEDAEMKKEGMHGMMEQDEAEAEEVDVEVEEDVEEVETDVDVDAASTALEDLGDALGLDLEITDEEGEEEADDEEEEELDLEEGMYELDESALRRELLRMRKARRIRESAEDEADQFGDGEIVGDVIEIDEEDLLNVLADELGAVDEPAVSDTVAESRRRRNARRNTGATRRAMREAATYKKAAAGLKKQLVEMNLFNAKLLYANKLLQNKNLNVKQQRAIVEALDNAKTLREAKLLYKSLSDSLARRGRSGKNLSESVRRTLGSSSRSTRSAQPSKNGVETDRWAVLAGIGK